MKSTKIVATLGPATQTKEMITQLRDAGVDVVRLNASHGSRDYLKQLIDTTRSVDKTIAILLDTQGPEVRTGVLENDALELEEGEMIEITNEVVLGTKQKITINYQKLHELKAGNTLLIDDGLIELNVTKNATEKNDKHARIIANIMNGGRLGNKKTVTIRGHSVDIPFLSDKDKEDILFGIKEDVDFIAASFVRSVKDVMELKTFIEEHKGNTRIIAKIEHADAVADIIPIIRESHGIMVARGDLGVEMPLEKVPGIQADIIKRCNNYGRPVIVATQMLESMKDHPRPTRAEVADVAQAIIQGADAIMLSGETAAGKYPVRAVKAMATIANEYEKKIVTAIDDTHFTKEYYDRRATSLFVTRAAALAAETLHTGAIITPTESGYTARKVSRFKPKCPIIAFTPNEHVLRQLRLTWGVTPLLEKKNFSDLDEMVHNSIKKSFDQKFIHKDDKVVITAGHKLAKSGLTNMVEVFRVQSILEK